MTTVRRVGAGAPLEDAFAVRREVFIREQGVSEAEEMDGRDDAATHVVAYDDGDPVGTARLRFVEEGVAKVERVAVRASHRGEGVGCELMAAVEDIAAKEGADRATLHAQTRVEGFYEKLGYETTSDVFEEAGIDHVEMEKGLRPGDA